MRVGARAHRYAAAACPALFFDIGFGLAPHPDKAWKGGEDTLWVSSDGHALGVFDGVSGDELSDQRGEAGWDPSGYSRSLATECEAHYTEHAIADPVALLHHAGTRSAHIRGSSTACVAVLDGATLRAATLGDSTFLVFRRDALLYRQPTLKHSFNRPFQLGPGSADRATDALVWTLQMEPSDVLVLASDGLFDNLYDNDIAEVVVRGPREVQRVADTLVARAAQAAKSYTARTPYAQLLREHDLGDQTGGRLDDITVIVARVRARD